MVACVYVAYLPELGPEFGWRGFKLQYKAQSPEEGLVDVVDEVCGEDDDAREPLNVVEQHTNIHIGIAVCGGAGKGAEREGGKEGGREGGKDGGRERG